MDWKVILTSFFMLFIAELGDKTQLTVFTLVAKNKQPIPVFIGASLALIIVTFLGAFFGDLVTKYIPEHIIRLIAGLLFISIGIVILKEVLPDIFKTYF